MQERSLWVAALAAAMVGSVGAIVAGVGGLDLYDKSKNCRSKGDTDLQHGRVAAIVGIALGCVGIVAVSVVLYFVVARWPEAMVHRTINNLHSKPYAYE
jgi:hypothetical protein